MKYTRPSPEKKKKIWVRDKFKCRLKISPYCIGDLVMENATVDHVIPLSTGGTNEVSNLVTACFPCNNLKGNRTYVVLPFSSEVVKQTEHRRRARNRQIVMNNNKAFRKLERRLGNKRKYYLYGDTDDILYE